MKLAIVMPLAEQRGGAELALSHLIQASQELDVNWVVIFLEDGSMVTQMRSLGAETHIVPAGRVRQPISFLKAVMKIASIAKSSQADLIFGWMSKAQLYGGLAAKFAGLPSLWYQHGLPSQKGWLDKVATALPSHGIFTCSKTVAEAQAFMKPSRPLQVVYPGVELESFQPNLLASPLEMRRQLGLPTTGPLIGIVGRLQRWKGMHTLIESMPKVLEMYPDAHAVIVGGEHDREPQYSAHLKQRIDELRLQSVVKMVGLQRNVPEWMQAMDIVIHASNREPFGMVIVEAMSLGKPVIAGANGGPTEIITPDLDGLLAPYDDSKALATAILRYLSDREFASQVGTAARKRAMDFSTQRYAHNFIAAVSQFIPIVSSSFAPY